MSIRQMNAVWKFSKQKGSKLLLMLAIADNADDDGIAFPGIDYLAQKIRMSARHVSRMIAELPRTGEVAIAWERGRGNSHRFYILLDKTEAAKAEIVAEVEALNAVKHDKLSSFSGSIKHDKLSVKHDKLSVKHDKLSVKHDIAMSSEPSEPIKREPVNRHDPPNGVSSLDWTAVLEHLANTVTKSTYLANFAGSRGELDGDTAVIVVKTQYKADWINGRLQAVVGQAIQDVSGREVAVFARPDTLRELAEAGES